MITSSLRASSLIALTLTACGGADISIGNNDGGGDAAVSDGNPSNDGAADSGADAVVDSPIGNDGTSGFDPASVSGLVLWLDANKGVTTTGTGVSRWADQTTFKNDATQGTAAIQPTVTASAINGLPGIHFNKSAQAGNPGSGNELMIADAPSLQWSTGDFYVIVVLRYDNDVAVDGPEKGEGLLYSKVAAGGYSFTGAFFVAGVPGGYNNGTPANGLTFSTSGAANNFVVSKNLYNNNTPHAFAMQRVGVNLDLRVDGSSIGTAASSGVDISNAGTPVSIGGVGNAAGLRLDGDIAEMLAVKGVLAGTDRTGLETYVKTKYGL